MVIILATGAKEENEASAVEDIAAQATRVAARRALAWYQTTPPGDRVVWAALVGSAVLGIGVILERMARLHRRGIVPRDFDGRFLERLNEGKLDRGKALDFCELNPSPATRVALAAVRRWGRPVADLERAVAMALRVEAARLGRNVGTLRRIAALTPLIGLLGTLIATGRALSAIGASAPASSWGPALGSALSPLTAGVALAILALVAYDGLVARVETLSGALDRVGAATIDAIAMTAQPEPRAVEPRSARTPHQVRAEPSEPITRPIAREFDGA